MGAEMPVISAVIARLANTEINLAAYGGVVFPLALIIEAPVIMLLSASVALSRHRQAYQQRWRFMMITSAAMTVLHMLVAFTPLYYFLVKDVIDVPAEIVEPARLGLMLMTPWTWSIAFRRFQQGVLIRYGYSGAVGMGTIIRLVTLVIGLTIGYQLGSVPGAAVGAGAQAAGVLAEAVYAGLRVRPVLRRELPAFDSESPLTWRSFIVFYFPLTMTSLISLLWQPVGSAGISRMPEALNSLAVWPVLSGLTFMLRGFGFAYNEVVVALLERKGAWDKLLRFGLGMFAGTMTLTLIFATPAVALPYFSGVAALNPALVEMAVIGIIIAVPMPAMAVLQNLFQGTIVYSRHTRGIPESTVVYFLTVLLALGIGASSQAVAGLYVAIGGAVIASAAQMGWLWMRARPVIAGLRRRDTGVN